MCFGFWYVFAFRAGISNAGIRESIGDAQSPGKRWETRERSEGCVKGPEDRRLWATGFVSFHY